MGLYMSELSVNDSLVCPPETVLSTASADIALHVKISQHDNMKQ